MVWGITGEAWATRWVCGSTAMGEGMPGCCTAGSMRGMNTKARHAAAAATPSHGQRTLLWDVTACSCVARWSMRSPSSSCRRWLAPCSASVSSNACTSGVMGSCMFIFLVVCASSHAMRCRRGKELHRDGCWSYSFAFRFLCCLCLARI